MIVASHQPNFLPYPGFFFKMYIADVFTISDTVKFSSNNYHHYNFFPEGGKLCKVTVPVSSHSGGLGDVRLSNWEHHSKKILKRIIQDYSRAPHFGEVYPELEKIFTAHHSFLTDLNSQLILHIHDKFKMDSKIIYESSLDIKGATPSEQIVDICRKTMCDAYLSGDGAAVYLDEEHLKENGIQLIWAAYKPLEYGRPQNASILDYIMYNGYVIPREWIERKERMHADNLGNPPATAG